MAAIIPPKKNENEKTREWWRKVIYTYILSFIQIQLTVLELEGFKENRIVT